MAFSGPTYKKDKIINEDTCVSDQIILKISGDALIMVNLPLTSSRQDCPYSEEIRQLKSSSFQTPINISRKRFDSSKIIRI